MSAHWFIYSHQLIQTMKQNFFSFLLTAIFVGTVSLSAQAQTNAIAGAWHTQSGDVEQTVVFIDGLVSHSTFDQTNKQFIATRGGTYSFSNGQLAITWEWDTEKAAAETPINTWLGQTETFDTNVSNALRTNLSGTTTEWTRIDNNDNPLAGVWYMTGRGADAKIDPNHSPGDRRTYKILTGSRFQWVAINIKTGVFSGTGGGNFTFVDGKYTENIEFFSRNNDRVGASLQFDGKLVDGHWHHSGFSSAGDPMYEVWSKAR